MNLGEHWFTLRRFGAAPKSVDDLSPGQGHWFNLNSFLQKPEWVGKLYLSMVLQQSEEEGADISRPTALINGQVKLNAAVCPSPGYSVFVVTRMDPTRETALPETDADRLAARLPDPSSGTSSLPVTSSHTLSSCAPSASRSRPHSPNSPSPRPWQEERSLSPMHQLLEATEADLYRDTSYPPYLREPPRRPGPDTHEGGLGGLEGLDHPDGDVEFRAAMEDRELQAALQASLMSGPSPVAATHPFFDAFQPHSDSGLESPLPLPVPPPLLPNPRFTASRTSGTTNTMRSDRHPGNRRSRSGSRSNSGSGSRIQSRHASRLASPTFPLSIPVVPEPEVDPDLDPVAASIARNRLIMERMRREQEMAFRDTFEDVDMEDVARRRVETQEEEEMLKRAIEESEKLAMEVDERQRQENQDHQPDAGGSNPTSPPRMSSSLIQGHRVYDDEDEELQAALRASLQDVPEGYQAPPSPPPTRRQPPSGLSLSRKQTLAPMMGTADLPSVITPALESGFGSSRPTGLGTSTFPKSVKEDTRGEEEEGDQGKGGGGRTRGTGDGTDSEFESEMEASFIEPKEDEVSVEEMRKRRLAKFGA